MKYTNNQPGYILTLTLGLIMLAMFLSTYVFNRGFIFARVSQTMVDREKARQLAFGGIQLAIAQLSVTEKKESKQEQPQSQQNKNSPQAQAQEAPLTDAKVVLKEVVPLLNQQQSLKLSRTVEGIDAAMAITLGSEEGKININRLYDFEKHAFIGEGQPNGDMKKFFQELFGLIKGKMNVDLFPEFEKFLKERKYPLNDVTELLTVKGFEVFKNTIFYDPAGKKDAIYLTDIFTISSGKKEIDPWLFSHSIIQLYLPKGAQKKLSSEEIGKTAKEQSNWKTDWNTIFKPVYGVEYSALPANFAQLFNPTFSPKIFSVLSSAKVGKVTVIIWVLLDREKGSGKDAAPVVKIRTVYLV
jgi:hypothetical protein